MKWRFLVLENLTHQVMCMYNPDTNKTYNQKKPPNKTKQIHKEGQEKHTLKCFDNGCL